MNCFLAQKQPSETQPTQTGTDDLQNGGTRKRKLDDEPEVDSIKGRKRRKGCDDGGSEALSTENRRDRLRLNK